MTAIISVKNLSVDYTLGPGEKLHALRTVDLDVSLGESVAIVGESGCGKSTFAYSLVKLVANNSVTAGDITVNGLSVLNASREELQNMRGAVAAMIFQDPAASLNPLFSVREQIFEGILAHIKPAPDRGSMEASASDLLEDSGFDEPGRILNSYPHQLSGGEQQRVMIAIALSCSPKILIADEPTTALDVTVQAQIMELLAKLKKEHGLTLLLITHDLNLAVALCRRVVVMYAGEIVEDGPIGSIRDAAHPYTHALFDIIPDINSASREFNVIKGSVPDLRLSVTGCAFEPRCARAREKCKKTHPDMMDGARCFFPYEKGKGG
jgi:oligopeptide/dipeptide ABC transporter ATP-binding protein